MSSTKSAIICMQNSCSDFMDFQPKDSDPAQHVLRQLSMAACPKKQALLVPMRERLPWWQALDAR